AGVIARIRLDHLFEDDRNFSAITRGMDADLQCDLTRAVRNVALPHAVHRVEFTLRRSAAEKTKTQPVRGEADGFVELARRRRVVTNLRLVTRIQFFADLVSDIGKRVAAGESKRRGKCSEDAENTFHDEAGEEGLPSVAWAEEGCCCEMQ